MLIVLNKLFFIFCVTSVTVSLFGFDVRSLPIHRIEAEKVHSEAKKIILEESVLAVLDMGTVTCGKAIIFIEETANREKKDMLSRFIEMEKQVLVKFSDGSILSADRGRIDCMKREGVFWGSDTEKVVYERSLSEESGARMRASGYSLHGMLVKTDAGWMLDDVNAEGAVCIEYRPKELKK